MSRAADQRVLFYSTPEHDCSYLAGQAARSAFVDPNAPKSAALYSLLLRHGFRRSGAHIYRPHCAHCAACVPVRVPVNDFLPSRRHRRTRRANADLQVEVRAARFDQELFALYRQYLGTRHAGGDMANPTPESFHNFLLCEWGECEFIEFRVDGALAAVAVTDVVEDGLSAVYTFFDPRLRRRSLGTNAVLWQITEARRRGLGYLYLGYWIARSPKMAYKSEFLPQQHFRNGHWTPVSRAAQAAPAPLPPPATSI